MHPDITQEITADITTLATDLGDTELLNQASNLPHAPLVVDAAGCLCPAVPRRGMARCAGAP